MPPQEQADLWMALRDRMKVNWAELTVQEKKAGMHISPPTSSLYRLYPSPRSPFAPPVIITNPKHVPQLPLLYTSGT
jgi:hypothetical protein